MSLNYFYPAITQVKNLPEYLNRVHHIVYADRHKGVPTFQSHWECGGADCTEHILKNCRTYCGNNGGKSNVHRSQVYKLQKQHTREGYDAELAKLRNHYPVAATYLNRLVHARVFLYAMIKFGFTTHFHATDNIAESFNSVIK